MIENIEIYHDSFPDLTIKSIYPNNDKIKLNSIIPDIKKELEFQLFFLKIFF